MAYEEALLTVNIMQDQLSGLARQIAVALKDKKVSPMEGIALGMKGMAFASSVIMLMQHADTQGILYVLENGDWVLPEGAAAPEVFVAEGK